MRTTAYALDALSDGPNEACPLERWLFWDWARPSNKLRGDRIFSIALALRPLYEQILRCDSTTQTKDIDLFTFVIFIVYF